MRFSSRKLPKIIKMAEKGLADWQIAHNLGIQKSTFVYWTRTHPELKLALEQAREPVIQEVENALFRRAVGYPTEEVHVERIGGRKRIKRIRRALPPDVKAISFFLTNRSPEKWKNSQKIEVDGNVVNVGNIDLSKLSDDQLGTLAKAIRSAHGVE